MRIWKIHWHSLTFQPEVTWQKGNQKALLDITWKFDTTRDTFGDGYVQAESTAPKLQFSNLTTEAHLVLFDNMKRR